MAKKAKPEKIDGLGPEDLKKIHKAVRQVWMWSHPWRLVKRRTLGVDGFHRCESTTCTHLGAPVPKIFVDHINAVGEIGGPDYIKKMWCSSDQLQGLCKKCHDAKTKDERKVSQSETRVKKKTARKSRKVTINDFY